MRIFSSPSDTRHARITLVVDFQLQATPEVIHVAPSSHVCHRDAAHQRSRTAQPLQPSQGHPRRRCSSGRPATSDSSPPTLPAALDPANQREGADRASPSPAPERLCPGDALVLMTKHEALAVKRASQALKLPQPPRESRTNLEGRAARLGLLRTKIAPALLDPPAYPAGRKGLPDSRPLHLGHHRNRLQRALFYFAGCPSTVRGAPHAPSPSTVLSLPRS